MRSLIVVSVVLVGAVSSEAQQAAVQQPVVGTTTVGTTVSVPDRGSAYLGGVNSAQSGRSSYGPLPSGSSMGSSRSASSMSASVYIHDLRAMDEAILNSVPDSPSVGTIRGRGVALAAEVPRSEVALPAEKAAKYERLAKQAEAAGRTSVAKLHWQMAAKYGSKLADEKLASSPPVRPASSQTAAKN